MRSDEGPFPPGFLWGGATAANQLEGAFDEVQLGEAIDDGLEILGYTAWGCIDLVSFTTAQTSCGLTGQAGGACCAWICSMIAVASTASRGSTGNGAPRSSESASRA